MDDQEFMGNALAAVFIAGWLALAAAVNVIVFSVVPGLVPTSVSGWPGAGAVLIFTGVALVIFVLSSLPFIFGAAWLGDNL